MKKKKGYKNPKIPMPGRHYTWDKKTDKVSIVEDLMTWAGAFESADRTLKKTSYNVGEISVSTVFLGIDHGFMGEEPVLWETMIFGTDDEDEYQTRYSSSAEARKGHKVACLYVEQWMREQGIKDFNFIEDLVKLE